MMIVSWPFVLLAYVPCLPWRANPRPRSSGVSSVDSGQQISVLLVLVLRSSSLSLGCFGLKGQGWSGLNENPGEA